jgi:hypothetical protein
MLAMLALVLGSATGASADVGKQKSTHKHINCTANATICTEVWDSEAVFGNEVYTGHDEPSVLFYSNTPGSGNQNQWNFNLPTEPSPNNPNKPSKSYTFELGVTFWLGMALCDTQSYPETESTCTPDSDSNISDPAFNKGKSPGAAFTELQFYPPGWVSWPPGISCDPTKWCVALTIDSLLENPVTGEVQNSTCANMVGIEPVQFAFLTLSGTPHAPPNPVDATLATYTPEPGDLLMDQGDNLVVTMHDTPNGLQTIVQDTTSGLTGSMTASAANDFAHVVFDPSGTSCTAQPYDFHPMYSTSSEQTRVPWAAHTYNVAFDYEIGHFDGCTYIKHNGGACHGMEGLTGDREPADPATKGGDDYYCYRSGQSLLVQLPGCIYSNTGFDGNSYQPLWPDGNTTLHPTSVLFNSPTTGNTYTTDYSRVAFEGDQPRVEDPTVCDRFTGSGCTLIPSTDDLGPSGYPMPATFYPFYSDRIASGSCWWQFGNHIPGSHSDFGQQAQYGSLLNVTYTGFGGHPTTRYNDFRKVLSSNPC